MLAAFPNIGIRSARLLLEHFGSLKAVIDADPEEAGIRARDRRKDCAGYMGSCPQALPLIQCCERFGAPLYRHHQGQTSVDPLLTPDAFAEMDDRLLDFCYDPALLSGRGRCR